MKEFFEDVKVRSQQWRFPVAVQSCVTVHSLVCKKHLLWYLYSIKTVLENIDYPLQINIYNDGTLDTDDLGRLRRVLPGAYISEESAPQAGEQYAAFPNLVRFAGENVFGKRLLHIYENRNVRNIVLDSDVLFFRKAERIGRWITNEEDQAFLYNCDQNENTVCIEDTDFANLDGVRIPHFNAGLMCFVQGDLNLQLAEKYFAYLYKGGGGGQWVWDQTVWSAMAAQSRGGPEPLPPQYTHTFDFLANYRPTVCLEEAVTRHYSKPKSLFFYEGVKYLISTGRA